MASLLKSSVTVPRSSAYPNSTPVATTTMAFPFRVTNTGLSSSDFKGLKMQCPKHTLTDSTSRQQRFIVSGLSARVSPVDEEKWDSLVLKSNSPLVLIFLFRAKWCMQSRQMKPIVDEISNNYEEDQLRCFALDVKKSGSIPMRYGFQTTSTIMFGSITMRIGFQTTPVILFFMSGEKKGEIQGLITKEELNEKIHELLSSQHTGLMNA